MSVEFKLINKETGEWIISKVAEHHTSAVPKVVEHLLERMQKIISTVGKEIETGMAFMLPNRDAYTSLLKNSLKKIEDEIDTHLYELDEFNFVVLQGLHQDYEEKKRSGLSPRNKLELVGEISRLSAADITPLKNLSGRNLTGLHRRLAEGEVLPQLADAKHSLRIFSNVIKKVEICWDSFLKLDSYVVAETLYQSIRTLAKDLKELEENDKFKSLYQSFFYFDDATRGLVEAESWTANVNVNHVACNFIDYIIRKMVKGALNYYKGAESLDVRKIFERLRELKITEATDPNVKILKLVQKMLDISPLKNGSLSLAVRKIGELHANTVKKLFEVSALCYLFKYFPPELEEMSKKTITLFSDVNKQFIKSHGAIGLRLPDYTKPLLEYYRDLNVFELTQFASMLEGLLLSPETSRKLNLPPTEENKATIDQAQRSFLVEMDDLRKVFQRIASRYHDPEEEVIFKCIEIIGSSIFKDLTFSCMHLMSCLQKEKKDNFDKEISPGDLQVIGAISGGTTKIDSYGKAIGSVVESLATFMGNPLRALVKEMLLNTPEQYEKQRKELLRAYQMAGEALKIFEEEN